MKCCRRRSRGFVLITMLVSTVTVLGLVGLAIDTAYLELIKIRAQTAADAAALGAVNERKVNGASGVAIAARADAALNGFTNGANGVTVAVNNPPASGYYTSDSNAVEVVVQKDVKALFLSLLGFQTMSVSARAVARLGAPSNCIYALDSASTPTAFEVGGGVTVTTPCGVMVNSSNNLALNVHNGSHLNAGAVSVVGNYAATGNSSISPTPSIHVDVEPDPLASLPAPAVGACEVTNYQLGNGHSDELPRGAVYCNGITVNGGATLKIKPGTYILKGGGLNISNGAVVTGTGVTFYITGGTGYNYAPVILNGGTTVTLSAPTSGAYSGVLFFSDRSYTLGAQSSFSNGTAAILTGTLYFPVTNVAYYGGSAASYTILIAKRLSFTGGTTVVNNNYSSLPAGPPVKGNASLSE
jgi:hypothetical protein